MAKVTKQMLARNAEAKRLYFETPHDQLTNAEFQKYLKYHAITGVEAANLTARRRAKMRGQEEMAL